MEQRLTRVGSINGGATPIMADLVSLGSDVAVRVTLSTAYKLERPIGYPFRPGLTGVDAAEIGDVRTISTGTTIALLKAEADALVLAGAATYA